MLCYILTYGILGLEAQVLPEVLEQAAEVGIVAFNTLTPYIAGSVFVAATHLCADLHIIKRQREDLATVLSP